MRKLASYSGLLLVLLLLVAAVGTYLAPHFGWRVDAVVSGSMEPELRIGSLVITRPVGPDEVFIGDPITFRLSGTTDTAVTHRVIDIYHSSPVRYQTKGDANPRPDPFLVHQDNLIGKICFHVPYMGYVTEFLKTPVGYVIGLIVPTVIIIAVYVRSIWLYVGNRNKQKANEI